jgi:DNA-binding NtrC family response regulator
MCTILIVDDEYLVLGLVRRVLADAGFCVLEAGSGAQALEVSKAHLGTIDVLLADLKMPGMSGRELAARLLKERPGTRIIYMSGYSDHLSDPGPNEHFEFVPKPFNRTSLLSKICAQLPAHCSTHPAPQRAVNG